MRWVSDGEVWSVLKGLTHAGLGYEKDQFTA
jgi:hypothetical protein